MKIRTIVLGHVVAVHAGENGDLADDVVDLILSILNVNDLDGYKLTSATVNASCRQSEQLRDGNGT
jgi:hypothetical protein